MSKAARNSFWMAVAFALAWGSALRAQEGPICTVDEALGRDLAIIKQAQERLKSGVAEEAINLLLPLVGERGDKLILLKPAAENQNEFSTYITLRESILRMIGHDAAALAEIRGRRMNPTGGELVRPGRLHASALSEATAMRWQTRADELIRVGEWNDVRDYLTPLGSNGLIDANTTQQAERLARLAYVSLLEGSPRRARQERDELATQYPTARAILAGREEVLLARVDQWLAGFSAIPPPNRTSVETQLGFRIEPKDGVKTRIDFNALPSAVTPTARFGVFPIFMEKRIYASAGDTLFAVGASSGALPESLYRATVKAERPTTAHGAMRHAPSLSEGIVYARLGSPVTRKRSAVPAGDYIAGIVVAVDTTRGDKLLEGFPISPGLDEEFDGAPLLHQGKMFLAVRKRDETRTEFLLRCIDVTTLKLQWERSICHSESRGRGIQDEMSQTALMLDGERIYAVPHLGCVACLDKDSGKIRWLTRYARSTFPRAEGNAPPRWERGLGAISVRGDLLVVLAADCQRVFALDTLSGMLKWSSRRELMNDAVYLLGATEDEIVLMGESVYWLEAATGQVKACYPERWVKVRRETAQAHEALGRGIWAGGAVWYPSSEAVLKVELDSKGKLMVTTALALPERRTKHGDLAWQADKLYWASGDGFMVWDAPREKDLPKKPLARPNE